MTDFLDNRSKVIIEKAIGDDENFEKKERERVEEARQYFTRHQKKEGKK